MHARSTSPRCPGRGSAARLHTSPSLSVVPSVVVIIVIIVVVVVSILTVVSVCVLPLVLVLVTIIVVVVARVVVVLEGWWEIIVVGVWDTILFGIAVVLEGLEVIFHPSLIRLGQFVYVVHAQIFERDADLDPAEEEAPEARAGETRCAEAFEVG
jgi:hypothetical protein